MSYHKVMIIFLSIFSTYVQAFDISLLKNDKEIISKVYTAKEMKNNRSLIHGKWDGSEINSKLGFILSHSIDLLKSYDNICDQRLIKELTRGLEYKNLPSSQEDLEQFIMYMRSENMIDDIFATIITQNSKLYFELGKVVVNSDSRHSSVSTKYEDENVSNLYQWLGASWPNGKKSCILNGWNYISYETKGILGIKKNKKLKRVLRSTNRIALKDGILSSTQYNELEVLRLSDSYEWPLSLRSYLETTEFAKNKLKDELQHLRITEQQIYDGSVKVDKKTRKLTSKYIKRRDKLTLRNKLYYKYNSEQIMMLADVLVKTSRRMNAYKTEINIQYEDDSDALESNLETYVVSPMEQYRMALKMLKKDIRNLELSKNFKNQNIHYNEIVYAAYETGVFGLYELEHIIKYEEFWNPTKPKWKSILDFVGGLAGTASLYLPPPWNIVGAISIVFIESKIRSKNNKVDARQNTNSIF